MVSHAFGGTGSSKNELRGRTVAFTGRLASLTRREAERVVGLRGGRRVDLPTRGTDFLVVGRASCPVEHDGRPCRKLRRVEQLRQEGFHITVLTEDRFLAKLGLGPGRQDVRRLFHLAQLTRILAVSRDRLRHWIRTGWICPRLTVHGLAYFDFHQVARAKSLWGLLRDGVPLERVQASLRQLETWIPDVPSPLAQLTLLERGRRVFVRLSEGRLADSRGQLYFAFFAESSRSRGAPVAPPAAESVESWIEVGLKHEEGNRLDEALHAYRTANGICAGAPEPWFHLGNLLYGQGVSEEAVRCLERAVGVDPNYAEAWNNLGNVAAELGQPKRALTAWRRALEVDPAYADAHYNLAEGLRREGRLEQACFHWKAFLQEDSTSSWAEHVRERLREPPPLGQRRT